MAVVLLSTGTVGATAAQVEVGQVVEVTLHDENGNQISETGQVEEVLE